MGQCCDFCQQTKECGLFGYGFMCGDCAKGLSPLVLEEPSNKLNCPRCTKRIKKLGLLDHIKDCHAVYLGEACEALYKVLEDAK